MKVRLLQQVSGTRDGLSWPAPGTVVDLPDVEARALINGGAATDDTTETDTVMVPQDGIHMPGDVGFRADDTVKLVEAPADAVVDPEGAVAAVKARKEGNVTEVPRGTGVQHRSGAALSPDDLDDSVTAEKQTREDLAVGQLPKVGEPAPKRATKADKGAEGGTAGQPKTEGHK